MDHNKISYIGVKGLIVRHDGNVLITQEPIHFQGGGKWELPGGKIAEGEESFPLEQILLREVEEELGKSFKIEIRGIIDVMRRPWNKPGARADQVMLAVFECLYRDGDVTLSDENDSYAWIGLNDIGNYTFVSGYLPVLRKYLEKHSKVGK